MRKLVVLSGLFLLLVFPSAGLSADRLGPPGQQFCNGSGWVLPNTTVYTCGFNYWYTSTVSTSGGGVNCSGSNGGVGNGFLEAGPILWRCSPASNWVVTRNTQTYTRSVVSNHMGWSVYFVWQVAT